jgi:hypothetical protein
MTEMKIRRKHQNQKATEYKYSHLSLEEEILVNPMMARIIVETYESMSPWQRFLMETVATCKKILRRRT